MTCPDDFTSPEDCLCAGCGQFTCHSSSCGIDDDKAPDFIREVEMENRAMGDFDLADMTREVGDSYSKGVLDQRIATRRVSRWIEERRS